MTQDEIIEMARQAGVRDDDFCFEFSEYKYLEHFAKLIADKAFQNGYEKGIAGFNAAVSLEREACAKLCEAQDEFGWGLYADAIRARGEQA